MKIVGDEISGLLINVFQNQFEEQNTFQQLNVNDESNYQKTK